MLPEEFETVLINLEFQGVPSLLAQYIGSPGFPTANLRGVASQMRARFAQSCVGIPPSLGVSRDLTDLSNCTRTTAKRGDKSSCLSTQLHQLL